MGKSADLIFSSSAFLIPGLEDLCGPRLGALDNPDSPSIPFLQNRLIHLYTILRETPTALAVSLTLYPSASKSIILPRVAIAALIFSACRQDSMVLRSSSDRMISEFVSTQCAMIRIITYYPKFSSESLGKGVKKSGEVGNCPDRDREM